MIKDIIGRISSDEGNAIRYRIICSFCFLVHIFYAILFTCCDVRELMIFNYISSTLYLTSVIIARNSRITIFIIGLISVEIMLHCFLCGYYLGFDYMFVLYSVSIVPVTFFMTYLDPAIRYPVITSSVIAVINFIAMIASLDVSAVTEVKYVFPRSFLNFVARMNIIFCILILISFSIVFLGKIKYDLAELKAQNEALDRLANYDQLTGLRNRNHIYEIFEQYIKGSEPYCIILGDIDDFKSVNDTFGHSAGDDVLKTVSGIIRKDVGNNGTVCRWGGEEILILVKGDAGKCFDLNEKILSDIRSATVLSGDTTISVTMTFGLCGCKDEKNIEKLISLADKRLYIGKRNGKNQIVTES